MSYLRHGDIGESILGQGFIEKGAADRYEADDARQ